MSIRVHNSEHFEELRQSAAASTASKRSRSPGGTTRPFGSPIGSMSPTSSMGSKSAAAELSRESQMKRVAMKHELYKKEQEALQKQIAAAIAESLQKQKNRKEAQFLKLQQDVEDGKALAEELREKLELQEQSRTRQITRMHDEWSDGVFHKLNDPVAARVGAMDSAQLNARKAGAYQKFLDITNKKGGLFRDIIIESEYNPLQDVTFLQHRAAVDDPVKRALRRRDEEDAIARAGDGSSSARDGMPLPDAASAVSELGRSDNLDVTLWSKGVLESTPYGYFHKMMTSTASASGARTQASHIKFDHDAIETGPEVVARELPRGKRVDFARHGVNVQRTSIELS